MSARKPIFSSSATKLTHDALVWDWLQHYGAETEKFVRVYSGESNADGCIYRPGYIDAFFFARGHLHICEVKSEQEDWNAGGVIRQMHGYRNSLEMCELRKHAGFKTERCYLYSGRAVTAAERRLIESAGIHVRVYPDAFRFAEGDESIE